MKKFFKTIDEVPLEIVDAYRNKKYMFNGSMLPVQAHTHWNEVNWINHVSFSQELEKLRCDSKLETL